MSAQPAERGVRIAVVTATLVILGAVASADATAASSVNPCKMLSAKQVAAVHVSTSCKVARGKPNPYYTGVSATWGQLGGKSSVILSGNRVSNRAYIGVWESQNAKGKSAGVGSWSRGSCARTGAFCIVDFVVGNYVVQLQVAPPIGKPLASQKQFIAMAKTVAAGL